jgi:DNA-binding MarR family transcriptional regulator
MPSSPSPRSMPDSPTPDSPTPDSPTPDSPTPDSTALLIALGAVVKRIKHRPIPENPALHGVPFAPRHVSMLLQIAQDGPIGMSELAERMQVSLATASQVVGDLETWGLVVRSSDISDRRRTLTSVAPEHRAHVRAIFEQRLRPLDRTLRRLEPDQRAGLIQGLITLAEELDRAEAAAKEASR